MGFRKLSADDRIDEIVEAVEALIVRDRTLAFGMSKVASEIDASRALIYVYFESVGQIIDELCRRHLELLDLKLSQASGDGDPPARAQALGQAYLDYLVEYGPVLTYILRDANQVGAQGKSIAPFRRVMRALATDVRARLEFAPREALVLVELLSAIPTSLASQVRSGRIELPVARDTCDRLMGDLVNDLRVQR